MSAFSPYTYTPVNPSIQTRRQSPPFEGQVLAKLAEIKAALQTPTATAPITPTAEVQPRFNPLLRVLKLAF